ncbi:MAG: hypothetical protein ACI9CA_000001 [Natronomonas sp.]|jgi:hypothetical protein
MSSTQQTLTGDSGTSAGGAPSGDALVGDPLPYVPVGAVVWFTRKAMHGHVTLPDGTVPSSEAEAPETVEDLRVEWLDGYDEAASTVVSVDALDEMAEDGHLRGVAYGVEEPRDRWADPHATRHPPADEQALSGPEAAAVNAGEPVDLRARTTTDAAEVARVWSRDRRAGLLEHPIGNHKLGQAPLPRAMLVARRPDGQPSAAAVLSRPSGRMVEDGTVELSRYISHPDAEQATGGAQPTNNTATWLISRAARWAALEGFDTLLSYSGNSDNDGTIYSALPFEHDGWSDADGDGWQSHGEGRSRINNARSRRKRWTWELHDGATSQPRRAADRDHGQATLAGFATSDRDERTTANFGLAREERPKYHRDSGVETPADERAMRLFREHGPDGAADLLATRTRSRKGDDKPPAIFGAAVDGHLVAAVAVEATPTATDADGTRYRTHEEQKAARVIAYADAGSTYPQNTATWLLSRAREWADLAGYDGLTVEAGAFPTDGHAPTTENGAVQQAVGAPQSSPSPKPAD